MEMAVSGRRGLAAHLGQWSARCLVLSLVAASGALAQPAEPFRDSVDVEVVEIDVLVTDRKGHPVRGLKREDFELTVDGRSVEISNFFWSSIRDEAREWANRRNGGAGARLEPGRVDGGPGPSPLTVVLYLDDLNTYPAHRTRLLLQLKKAIEPWRRMNAQFMLAAFVDRLEVLVPPTRDVDALLQAAASRPKGQARALEAGGGRQRALREMILSDEVCEQTVCEPCVDNWGDLMAIARTFAYEESTRVAVASDGLADLVSTLAGVTGRKAVVYVSSGMPQRPGLSAFSYLVEQLCPPINSEIMRNLNDAAGEMLGSDEGSRFNRVSAHANANRVTIFAVDAAGLRANSGSGVSFSGRTSFGELQRPSPRNDSLYATNAQRGLFLLADETGGKALVNSNDLVDLLDDVTEQVSNTYSLGFLLTDRRPKQVRQVEVALARGAGTGRRLTYRRSFRDKTLEERLAERLLSFAYLGDGENPLGASLDFAPSTPLGQKPHGLIVEVAVPDGSVTSLPRHDGGQENGRLRLWMVAVEEEKGFRSTVRQTGVRVGGADGVPAISGAYRFEVDITLPEGAYELAVGVRDETTGVMSLLRDAVTVPLGPPD